MPIKLDEREEGFSSKVTKFDSKALLERYATIEGVSLVELNFPEHVTKSSLKNIAKIVERLNLKVSGLSVRFPKELFRNGAFTNPSEEVRKKAVQFLKDACELLCYWEMKFNAWLCGLNLMGMITMGKLIFPTSGYIW